MTKKLFILSRPKTAPLKGAEIIGGRSSIPPVDTSGFSPEGSIKNGFLLVEVLITVVILSAGIMFLVKAFSTSLNSAKLAADYSKAVILLENKLTEFQLDERLNDGITSTGRSRGDFPEGFTWVSSLSADQKFPDLAALKLTLSWAGNKKGGSVDLDTYLSLKQ